MQKIRIVGLQADKQRVINALHKAGVIEVRKSALEMGDDKPGESLAAVSELLVRYHSAETILNKYIVKGKRVKVAGEAALPTQKLIQTAGDFKDIGEILSLDEKKTNYLENEIAKIDAATRVASLFAGSKMDFSILKSNVLGFSAYSLDKKKNKENQKAIGELRTKCEVIENRSKAAQVVFVAYPKNDGALLEKIEHAEGVGKIDLSNSYLDSTPEKVLGRLKTLKDKLLKENQNIVDDLRKYAARDLQKIRACIEMLSIETERQSVSINFKSTESTFVLEGWVEEKKLERLEESMKELTEDRFFIEPVKANELAPTLVRRPKFLRPFDKLLEFFSLPRSDELDPTWIFIITFPIFYGLMVSDVGYGIVSLFFALWVARTSDPEGILHNVAKVWQLSSISVIVFGFLSNQYFGFQLNQYFTSFTGFDWLRDTPTILLATIIFGLLQVVLGLLFGFVNSYHHNHKKIAYSKLTSIVVIVTGTIAVAGGLFGLIGIGITEVCAAIAVVGVLATIVLAGEEATEVVSLISHPLSYARIMGFGLASVILALLIDKTFMPVFNGDIIGFAGVLIVFILLHFLNMILGIFEGLVQGVRLNFVEFFSKFYTGGGIKFRPFSYKRNYTKEV